MSEAQNPFFITHDNQITIIQLTHVNNLLRWKNTMMIYSAVNVE